MFAYSDLKILCWRKKQRIYLFTINNEESMKKYDPTYRFKRVNLHYFMNKNFQYDF